MNVQTKRITPEEFERMCKFNPVRGKHPFDEYMRQKVKPLVYLCARRKWGKTALMLRLAENFFHETKETIYLMGFPNARDLPEYMIPIQSPWEISRPGLLLVDEAGLNKVKLNEILAISGHKDFGMIYAGQSLKQIKPSTLELIDGFIYKKPSTSQEKYKMYREEFKDTMKILIDNIDKLEDKSCFYFEGESKYDGWYNADLPSFWVDGVTSKGHKDTIK